MIITHHKGECIKVSFGDTTLVFNPVSKKSKLPVTRFGTDIALVTMENPDFNGIDEVTRAGKDVFAIRGPGEYEIRGIFVKGVPSRSEYGLPAVASAQAGGISATNTMYAVQMEDMNIVFLGALSEKKPDLSIVEDMDSVDILFVPIGSDGVLEAADAHALSVELEAKIIIPIHHDGIGDKGAVKAFLKEAGAEDAQVVDKLTIKRKDLEGKTGEVVVLKSV